MNFVSKTLIILINFETLLCSVVSNHALSSQSTGAFLASPPEVTISFPDVGDYDFQNDSLSVMSNSNPVFEMLCSASYPVEWIFHYSPEDDGTSEQLKLIETRRSTDDFMNASSYTYTTNMRLEYKGKILSLTNFTCRQASPWNIVIAKELDSLLQTHVLMTEENGNSLILLTITHENPFPPKKGDPKDHERTCDQALASTAQGPGFLMPCWTCTAPLNGKDLDLDYNPCLTPSECRSMFSRHAKGKGCLRHMTTQPKNCKGINPDFNPNIILCKNFGPALAQLFFFGLYRGESLKDFSVAAPPVYYDWSEVDPQQMLYVHPIARDVIYVGEEIKFTCEYSRYYFSLGSWFGIRSSNKTKYIKAIDQKPCNFDAEKTNKQTKNCTLNESWRGTFKASFAMNFIEVGIHEVFCIGPVWNSTEWVNTSLTFDVKVGQNPVVYSVEPETNAEFIVGQQHRKLLCRYSGKPYPTVKWSASDNEVQYFLHQLDNYTSSIEFPEIGFQTSGNYGCTVSSYLGSDSKTFSLKSRSENVGSLSTSSIVCIILSVLIIFAIMVSVITKMVRIIQLQRKELRLLTEAEVNEFLEGDPELLKTIQNDCFNKASSIDALPYEKKYEILVENFIIDYSKVLGSGAFGMVFKGKVKFSDALNYVDSSCLVGTTPYITLHDSLDVAIKVSKGNLDVGSFKALLSEIKVMAYLGSHPNIVSLVGASTQEIKNRELYIAVEYCENGSLDNYLKKYKQSFENTLSKKSDCMSMGNLLKWTCDVADGLEYIHSKKIIHADLASRNILLCADLRAKIGDFGLSRQLVESSNYIKTTKCPLPWRNMAIESLKSLEFSVKSDMWAFGVTLWEMFTLSDIPYPGLNYTLEFVNLLEQGLRLYKPPLASNPIYDYMLMCWKREPLDRPGTGEIKTICLNAVNSPQTRYLYK